MSRRLFYFTCMRVSPLFPNWFINLCAPLTPIPLRVFALGTCIGLLYPCCTPVCCCCRRSLP